MRVKTLSPPAVVVHYPRRARLSPFLAPFRARAPARVLCAPALPRASLSFALPLFPYYFNKAEQGGDPLVCYVYITFYLLVVPTTARKNRERRETPTPLGKNNEGRGAQFFDQHYFSFETDYPQFFSRHYFSIKALKMQRAVLIMRGQKNGSGMGEIRR